MYLCLDCGGLFEKPYEYKEQHGFDSPPHETVSCCPYCKGDYVKTYQCDSCGGWIENNTYYEVDKNKYCEQCCTKLNLGD